jgi:antitoxin FitA
MANVLVRDLPEEVHASLVRRAQEQGQSLQAFLSGELRRIAERPTLQEVLDRVEGREGGRVGLRQAADDLAAERARQ